MHVILWKDIKFDLNKESPTQGPTSTYIEWNEYNLSTAAMLDKVLIFYVENKDILMKFLFHYPLYFGNKTDAKILKVFRNFSVCFIITFSVHRCLKKQYFVEIII